MGINGDAVRLAILSGSGNLGKLFGYRIETANLIGEMFGKPDDPVAINGEIPGASSGGRNRPFLEDVVSDVVLTNSVRHRQWKPEVAFFIKSQEKGLRETRWQLMDCHPASSCRVKYTNLSGRR